MTHFNSQKDHDLPWLNMSSDDFAMRRGGGGGGGGGCDGDGSCGDGQSGSVGCGH